MIEEPEKNHSEEHPPEPDHSHGLVEIPHGDGGHVEEGGEGNWLVSYADMMTLLVGFFVLLMSFSTIDQEKFEELKRAAIQQFGGSYQVPYGDMADRIRSELEKMNLGQQFVVKQTDLGVEISFVGTVFFDTGSADIKEQGLMLLQKLIPIVKTEAKDNFNIIVEGHTDDVPLIAHVKFRDNWELSSIRACRVLAAFESVGIPKPLLTAVGYADARGIVPNRDGAGLAIPQNQSQNRRVVIKLLKRSGSVVTGDASPTTGHQVGQEM